MRPVAHLLFVVFALSQCGGVTARYFPDLQDLALGSPMKSSSTCGETNSKYCAATSLGPGNTCTEKDCKFSCCDTCTSSPPTANNLGRTGTKSNVYSGQPRPEKTDYSLGFDSRKNSKISVSRISAIDHEKRGFTICVWVNQTDGNVG